MATHQLPAQDRVIDTSRYERVDERLVERPLPNEGLARIQLAVTILLREEAKALNLSVLQEWTLDEHDQPAHNWMTPDVLVAAVAAARGIRTSSSSCSLGSWGSFSRTNRFGNAPEGSPLFWLRCCSCLDY